MQIIEKHLDAVIVIQLKKHEDKKKEKVINLLMLFSLNLKKITRDPNIVDIPAIGDIKSGINIFKFILYIMFLLKK